MPSRPPQHVPGAAGWTVEVLPDHADATTRDPCAVVARSNNSLLTPAGQVAALAAMSGYLTAVNVTAMQRLGSLPHFTVAASRLVLPVLGKDATAQANALAAVLGSPGNVV